MSGLKPADANPREPTNYPDTEHPSSNALSSDRLIPFRTPFYRSLAHESRTTFDKTQRLNLIRCGGVSVSQDVEPGVLVGQIERS